MSLSLRQVVLVLLLVGMLLAVAVSHATAGVGGNPGRGSTMSEAKGKGGAVECRHVETRLTAEQQRMAHIIWDAAEANHAGRKARVIAYAAAIQESGLKDLEGGHADSQGLYQMRGSFPEQWGTYAQLDSPRYQADRFFEVLLGQNEDYRSEPVTVAAQEVLRSAYPKAYAAHVDEARSIVRWLSGEPCRRST